MPKLEATQANRSIVVTSPLGEDVLLFHSMSVNEKLGRLFQFDLDLLSEDPEIKLQDILAQNVTIRYQRPDGESRYFNGFVNQFSQAGTHGNLFVYRATLRPWFWFLTRTADCRIFQNKTVPDIIKEVFRDKGFSDFEDTLSDNYREWENCVQYRETDFNFVSRLMEQEGMYYYFKHEDGKHTLVLSDSISSHETESGYEEVPYYPPEQSERRERDHISDWSLNQVIQPGVYALNDYDFKKPKANLEVKSSVSREHDQAEFEIYDYPGEYKDSGDGEGYARARIEELQSQYEEVQGEGNVAGLMTGCLFKLIDYPREDQNREYLITAASYNLGPQEYESDSAGGSGSIFSCDFTAIDKQQVFRAPRTTPKPIVQGPQTAIVVGKAGEEIWTDQYGRVKVQFHWDRYGMEDENSSCWVRVSQNWAGKSWGGMFMPHIGHEVIISFLEGDPDQPIITGRVYNDTNMPPEELPGNQTKSVWKDHGDNHIILEGKKGSEEINIHAEKNQNINVKNDVNETVHNDINLHVDNDINQTVENDINLTVENDINQTVENDINLTVEHDINQTVENDINLTVENDINLVVENDFKRNVLSNSYFFYAGDVSIKINGKEEKKALDISHTEWYGAKSELYAAAKSTIALAVVHDTFVGAKLTTSLAFEKKIVGGYTHTYSKVKEIRKTKKMDLEATESYQLVTKDFHVLSDVVDITGEGVYIKLTKDKIEISATEVEIKGNLTVTGNTDLKKEVEGKYIKW